MKRHDTKEYGFATVGLTVIGAIVILAIAGGLVYKHHQNQTKVVKTTVSTKQPPKTQPTQPVQSKTAYLDIAQWGIKLPLTTQIKDAYYIVGINTSDTTWLGLKSLNGTDCDATQANTQAAYISAVGSLERVTPTEQDPAGSGTYMAEYPGAKVGGYYYAYVSETANKSCASQSALNNINTAFSAAAKSIVSDN